MRDDTMTLDEKKLLELAGVASQQMKKIAVGKPSTAPTHSTAGSFASLAAMLDALTTGLADRRADQDRLEKALRRIAALEIRSATELLERGDWKKIAAELQAIATEAVQVRRLRHG